MTYKILSTKQIDEILFTTVEYSFDGNVVTVEVAHYMPKSEETIKQNIINRASTEVAKIEAAAAITTLVESIVIGEIKSIE
jgi:hypothetical protein